MDALVIRSGGRGAPGRRGRKCGHAEATLQRNFAVNGSEETRLQLSRGQGPGGCFLFSSWEIPVCVWLWQRGRRRCRKWIGSCSEVGVKAEGPALR